MRRILQKMFSNPLIRLSNKYSSRPDQERVHKALTTLYKKIQMTPSKRGLEIEYTSSSKIIVFSDQHKGTRNNADDFAMSEKNYISALNYYNSQEFVYCNLGDSEELWKNLVVNIVKHNKATFEAEKLFINRNAFIKVFGNHDLYWDNDPLSGITLERIYGKKVKIYEGVIFKMKVYDKLLAILLTHGHQGDLQSDGNWFSKWFVSNIWGPIQGYLQINPNTPAYDNQLKSEHNAFMYNWTAKQSNLVLITGHTHQPVFNSLTHLERLYLKLENARRTNDLNDITKIEDELKLGKVSGDTSPRLENSKNTYFNTGCCCFSDGDITGIELEGNKIRLVKWKTQEDGSSKRFVLEENEFENLLDPILKSDSIITS